MKKSLIILAIFVGIAAVSFSCKKKTDCYCTASKNGKTFESYTYKDIERSECTEKVDEITESVIGKYSSDSLVGVKFECDFL